MQKNSFVFPKIGQVIRLECSGMTLTAKIKYFFKYGLMDEQIVLDVDDSFPIKNLRILNGTKEIVVESSPDNLFSEKTVKIHLL